MDSLSQTVCSGLHLFVVEIEVENIVLGNWFWPLIGHPLIRFQLGSSYRCPPGIGRREGGFLVLPVGGSCATHRPFTSPFLLSCYYSLPTQKSPTSANWCKWSPISYLTRSRTQNRMSVPHVLRITGGQGDSQSFKSKLKWSKWSNPSGHTA